MMTGVTPIPKYYCRGCHRQIDESYILFDAEGMIHLRHGKEPCGPVVEQPAKKANDA